MKEYILVMSVPWAINARRYKEPVTPKDIIVNGIKCMVYGVKAEGHYKDNGTVRVRLSLKEVQK